MEISGLLGSPVWQRGQDTVLFDFEEETPWSFDERG
jgi:hypothetical protein